MTTSVPEDFRADLLRWQHLVSPVWLEALIAGRAVAAAPGAGWQLLEVACDGMQPFLESHIACARYLDTRLFEQLPFWNALPDGPLQSALAQAGVHAGSSVILYGRNPLAAARLAHLMLYAGVSDVRLLDGGLKAWCAAGFGLQRGPSELPQGDLHEPMPLAAWPNGFPANPGYKIDTEQARALSTTPGAALVSIRIHAEYMGETSGYDYIAVRGEIPGALWGHAGSDGDVNNMGSYQDDEGCMRPAAEIERLWNEAGICRDMRVAFYCGTGWRASLAFFYAWLMGWEHISMYDGGWMEWSSNAANPVICRAAGVPLPARPQSDPATQSRPT